MKRVRPVAKNWMDAAVLLTGPRTDPGPPRLSAIRREISDVRWRRRGPERDRTALTGNLEGGRINEVSDSRARTSNLENCLFTTEKRY